MTRFKLRAYGQARYLLWAMALLVAIPAWANKSGVAPSRLKLPQGPGSLEGLGENAEIRPNMGLMSYGINIEVPKGYNSNAPGLRLDYSSGNGNSVVGVGWAFTIPEISRMTSKGLPTYTLDDTFSGESGELVYVGDFNGARVYRARFEGGFIRYQWKNAGADTGGYWIVEYPTGARAYFGADANGKTDELARVVGSDGVFRYHLVEHHDALGHKVVYGYHKSEGLSLLDTVHWGFENNTPHYEVAIEYENRPDQTSQGQPGFLVKLAERIKTLRVRVDGQKLRRYKLNYKNVGLVSELSEFSRLESVDRYGRDDITAYPIAFGFEYTKGYKPRMFDMILGENVQFITNANSEGELVDLNRDGLPDMLDTREGNHRMLLNQPKTQSRSAPEFLAGSSLESGGIVGAKPRLNSDNVYLVDINGDGFTDMIDGNNEKVYWNTGDEQWEVADSLGQMNFPPFATNKNLRFLDIDGDKDIDALNLDPGAAWFHVNNGDGSFAQEVVNIEPLGVGFQDGIRLADMNGDGLQDLVQPTTAGVFLWLNLGHGRFEQQPEMTIRNLNSQSIVADESLSAAKYADINGDGLADAIWSYANKVEFCLNRNGEEFECLFQYSFPNHDFDPSTTSLRFADINGNGTTDIVWVTSDGAAAYLELFEEKPNLLSRLTNNVGKITEVIYGTSVEHMARDGGTDAWVHRLPHAMTVVNMLDVFDTLTMVHNTTTYRYHQGYYDGIEKQFRGFAEVEILLSGDSNIESGRKILRFDVGADDPYFKGKKLEEIQESGGAITRHQFDTWSDCPVAQVPSGSGQAVRFLCKTGHRVLHREDASGDLGQIDESSWVTTESLYDYDGYGNTVLTSELGVIGRGGALAGAIGSGLGEHVYVDPSTLAQTGCEPCQAGSDERHGMPCGAQCLGDEMYSEAYFIEPGANTQGRWLTGAAYLNRTYGKPISNLDADTYAEIKTYYDGPAFVGLASQELTHGLVTRTEAKMIAGSNERIQQSRFKFDSHGNPVESWDAKGNRITFEYDASERFMTGEVHHLDEANYAIKVNAHYDEILGKIDRSYGWSMGASASDGLGPETHYAYDIFGRLVATALPGDTLAQPTAQFHYEFSDPVSRISKKSRSQHGGPFDIENIQCFNGRGLLIQKRDLISGTRYQVRGFTIYNNRDKPKRVYQPYESAGAGCDLSPPLDVPFTETFFDGEGRITRIVRPDAAMHNGTASETRYQYGPLQRWIYDGEDNDPLSPHFQTPTRQVYDGLNRVVKTERLLSAGGAPIATEVVFDSLGNLHALLDDEGMGPTYNRDLLGRVARLSTPGRGSVTFDYDAMGSVLSQSDARGITMRNEYDALNRTIGTWEDGDKAGTFIGRAYDVTEECDSVECGYSVGKQVAASYPLGGGDMGSDRFGYNARGEPVMFGRTLGGNEVVFRSGYDNVGRVKDVDYGGIESVAYEYDGLSRLTSVPDYVDGVDYTPRGLLGGMHYANGTMSQYRYDENMALTGLLSEDRDGESFQDLHYTRNRVGHVVGVDDRRLANDGPSGSALYEHDSLYRLREADLDPASNAWRETMTYTYDRTSRLLKKISSLAGSAANVGVYDYAGKAQGLHAVTSTKLGDTTTTYEYDAAGNMIRRGTDTLQWDGMGRLVSVRDDAGHETQMVYGAQQDRVIKRASGHVDYYFHEDFVVRDGVATIYVRVGDKRIAKIENIDSQALFMGDWSPGIDKRGKYRVQSDGVLSAADGWAVWALEQGDLVTDGQAPAYDADEVLAAAAKRLVLAEDRAVSFLYANHLGTNAASTNAAGKVVQTSSFYPFGELRHASHGFTEDYGFTGKETDTSTGLSYFGFRYLDPHLGRWISMDPLTLGFNGKSVNSFEPSQVGELHTFYQYSGNSPINFVDHEGLESSEDGTGSPRPESAFLGKQALGAQSRQGGAPQGGGDVFSFLSLFTSDTTKVAKEVAAKRFPESAALKRFSVSRDILKGSIAAKNGAYQEAAYNWSKAVFHAVNPLKKPLMVAELTLIGVDATHSALQAAAGWVSKKYTAAARAAGYNMSSRIGRTNAMLHSFAGVQR